MPRLTTVTFRPSQCNPNKSLVAKKSPENILHGFKIRSLTRHENPPNTRHTNVKPFIPEGRWTLNGLDRSTMRIVTCFLIAGHFSVRRDVRQLNPARPPSIVATESGRRL